ncbi:hypothetical protein [Vulgatibacter sp.]|uniref:hypothetical protein n=1 Tax=Vulgatibacter sp. TaxID=1971226 RepID=UPI0035637D7F
MIGLLLALVAIFLAIASYMLWIYFQRQAEAVTYEQVLSRPSEELQALRARESEWLSTYGVVDKEKGLYRTPIDEGMKRFLQEANARRSAGQPQVVVPAAAPAPAAAEGEATEAAGENAPAEAQAK